MSTSRAIKPKRDDTQLSNWQPMPERAPSVERADQPTIARIIAMVGLFLLVLGALALTAPLYRASAAISPDWGFFFASIGICLIFYHTFIERDQQFRRLYSFVGLALVVGGLAVKAIAFRGGYEIWFMLGGIPAMMIGLVFLIAVIRNESDASFRNLVLNVIGIEAVLMIGMAMVFGLRSTDYLAGEGVVLLILGLLFACTYIGQQDAGSDRSYNAGLALGIVGVFGIVATIVRVMLSQTSFFLPGGLVLSGMSIVYIAISVGICTDWPVILIARRDLAAYFYSPVGYFVFIGLTIMGGFIFFQFTETLIRILSQADQAVRPGQRPPSPEIPEPIVFSYVFSILPVIAQMFIVPVVTMRLLSEEKRSGTLEVLMTAPISDVSVVVGKLLACWIFYMLTWVPWWLYLVSLRYYGNQSFDYLPVLSFVLALSTIAGGLLSMGLFFSSLTSNQIIAAVLAFVGVMLHLVMYFLVIYGQFLSRYPAVTETLRFVNFFHLWESSLEGMISPRHLMFHLSVTIFFLFATVKILESRKWK